ncbi:hypothetical protein F5B18DRAFT_646930 [Nemania serpens]|nr:hypothetical protein F5B18DRAFT_646930 [Nemania serpens]
MPVNEKMLRRILMYSIMQLDPRMEPGKPLMAYGVDSLAGVELRNWIPVKPGAELSTLEIVKGSSLVALAEKVVGKLPKGAAA